MENVVTEERSMREPAARAMIEAAQTAARLHRAVERILEMAARRTHLDDLRVSDLWILLSLALSPQGTTTASSLVRASGASPHRSVTLLKDRGYLGAERSDADGRSRILSLTPTGQRCAAGLLLSFDLLLDAGLGATRTDLGALAEEVCASARRLGRGGTA